MFLFAPFVIFRIPLLKRHCELPPEIIGAGSGTCLVILFQIHCSPVCILAMSLHSPDRHCEEWPGFFAGIPWQSHLQYNCKSSWCETFYVGDFIMRLLRNMLSNFNSNLFTSGH